MKMCDILHARHVKVYLRFDAIFNMTKIKEHQEKLLNTIHGLTKRVIKEKKRLFEKNYKEGAVPTPSLSEIIANDYVVPSKPFKNAEGLRDDLDEIDENDVGKYCAETAQDSNGRKCRIFQVKNVVWLSWI